MKNSLLCVLVFSLGATVGSLVTYKALATKFNQMLEDELEAAREYYAVNKKTEDDKSEYGVEDTKVETDVAENEEESDTVKDMQHYEKLLEKYRDKEDEVMCTPYVIAPDEFGEIDGYETYELTYYADGVLADENDEPIEDVDELIGKNSLKQFGRFEEDSVHVRDESIKTDYEILRDQRRYVDVVGTKPHPSGDK